MMEYKIERIDFDGDFELIQKSSGGCFFDYPVLRIPEGDNAISLNRMARDLFPENTRKMFMITFMDYVAILPDDHKTPWNSLFAYNRKNGAVAYPATLRAKKIIPGYYKLYQYKDGVAFNRYERMDKDGNLIAA